MIRATRLLIFIAMTTLLVSSAIAQTDADITREITVIRGDLYHVRYDKQHSVFLVTPDGIIIGDPLTRPAAAWLKKELAERFHERPVRYVIHTSRRFDRSEGASEFNDTAELVGHRSFDRALSESRRSLPAFLSPLDLNHNGALERGEWTMTFAAMLVAPHDRDGDGTVTSEELTRFTRDVESSYDDSRTITLGGKTVRLIHAAFSTDPEETAIVFSEERVAFVPEGPILRGGLFSFERYKPLEAIHWVRAIAALDIDSIMLAGGEVASTADLRSVRDYLNALVEGVKDGHEVGARASDLERSPILDAFGAQSYFANRATHIAALYSTTRLWKVNWSFVGNVNYASDNGMYCASYATCYTRGAVPVGTASLGLSVGCIGVSGELTAGRQTWSSRTSDVYDDEIAFRQSRLAVLGSYATPRRGGFSFRFLGGTTQTIGDLRGMSRMKGGVAPYAGRHPLEEHGSRLGFTAGVDLTRAVGSRFSLVVPVRVTRSRGAELETWPGKTDLHLGTGISMRVLRQLQ